MCAGLRTPGGPACGWLALWGALSRLRARAQAVALWVLTVRLALALAVGLCLGLALAPASAQAAEVSSLRVERGEEGIYLTANVRFALPPPVEDALLKGIALVFVAEAEIYRERWYWADKRVASATRALRLAYQPLTRRWRVSQGAEGGAAGRVALVQTFDTLAEAQAAIERISRWKIAEASRLDGGGHWLDFRFRLDLSQLPRPFQIGMAGQRDWQISMAHSQPLALSPPRGAEPQPAELKPAESKPAELKQP